MSKFNICIIVPCFNESKKFLLQEYAGFIEVHPDTLLCFVNDGSSDDTLHVIQGLSKKYPKQVEIVSYKKNLGKAEAVRKGILHCTDNFDYQYIAYLDADLAVSLEECYSLTDYFIKDIIFCFGSRILKIGSVIERKRSRFLIGRLVATIISNILSLKVYDTQCGCKMFTKEIAAQLFSSPFISKWLFDVEIFFRFLKIFGKEVSLLKMIEIPLLKWTDKGDSKIRLTYFFYLWLDLYKIRKKYKNSNSK